MTDAISTSCGKSKPGETPQIVHDRGGVLLRHSILEEANLQLVAELQVAEHRCLITKLLQAVAWLPAESESIFVLINNKVYEKSQIKYTSPAFMKAGLILFI
ncbi:hypothetical protein [Neobacillus terrae]|uniref:hypothetical protein n=1 Tax=Neobacillus terrae TaxID=3034837 RepID=UPI00140B0C4E|nr:hypothetical protein [Neobacillus terrae]NHM29056.1 hypothetical protein [Neobacillus terrae]